MGIVTISYRVRSSQCRWTFFSTKKNVFIIEMYYEIWIYTIQFSMRQLVARECRGLFRHMHATHSLTTDFNFINCVFFFGFRDHQNVPCRTHTFYTNKSWACLTYLQFFIAYNAAVWNPTWHSIVLNVTNITTIERVFSSVKYKKWPKNTGKKGVSR